MTIQLKITGMSCGHCEKAVLNALQNVAGVEKVQVNLQEGTATVEGNAATDQLIHAITEEGYTAQLL